MSAWTDVGSQILWTASRDAAILVVVVTALLLVLNGRVAPKWRHLLWLLVALRLAMPVSLLPSSSFSWQNLLPEREAAEQVGERHEAGASPNQGARSLPMANGEVLAPPAAFASNEGEASIAAKTGSVISWRERLPGIAILVWALGVLLISSLAVSAMMAFAKRRRRLRVFDHPRQEELAERLAKLGGGSRVRLEISDAVRAPALFGLWRPVVLLPPAVIDVLSDEELTLVLRHELAHHERRDVWVNWGLAILQAVYWFHPLVWWAFRRARIEAEHATDERVLGKVGADQARSYGETLLRLLDGGAGGVAGRMPGMVGVVESRKDLRARMKRIGRYRGPGKTWAALMAVGMLGAVAVVGLTQAPDDDGAVVANDKKKNSPSEVRLVAEGPMAGYRLHVNVLVVDANDEPVEGAEVMAVIANNAAPQYRSPVLFEGRTGPDGIVNDYGVELSQAAERSNLGVIVHVPGKGANFEFLLGNYGEGSEQKRLRSDVPQTKVQLEEVDVVKVRVLQPDGTPVKNLRLWTDTIYSNRTDDEVWEWTMILITGNVSGGLWQGVTDDDGYCTIEDVPKKARLGLQHGDKSWAGLTVPGHIRTVGIPAGTKTSILSVEPAVSISGQVVDARGEGVFEAVVVARPLSSEIRPSLQHPSGKTFTDRDGRYRIEQLGFGAYNVQAALPFRYSEEPWIVDGEAYVEIEPGGRIENQNFHLKLGGKVIGKKVDADSGKEIAEPMVWTLPAGDQETYFSGAPPVGYHSNHEPFSVTVKSGENQQVDLEFQKILVSDRLHGIVVDVDGKAVEGAEVKVTTPLTGNHPLGVRITGVEGTFEFVLPRGSKSVTLLARKDGQFSFVDSKYSTGNEAVRVEIGPDRAARATGRVVDMNGEPISGATVSWHGVRFPSDGERSVVTDAEGKFQLADIPQGNQLDWFAKADGFGAAQDRHAVVQGKTTSLPDIKLPRTDSFVAGGVIDAQGDPVAGAVVRVEGYLQKNHESKTNDQGKFRIDQVVDRWLWVRAYEDRRPDEGYFEKRVRVHAGDENVVVRLPSEPSEWQEEKIVDFVGKQAPKFEALHWINGAGINADHTAGGKARLVCIVGIDRSLMFHENALKWMQRMRKKFGNEDDIEVLVVHGSWPIAEIEEVLAKDHPGFDLPLAVESQEQAMSAAFGVQVGLTVVIDKLGVVQYQGRRGKDAEAAVKAVLKEGR